MALKCVVEYPFVVVGGGASEAIVSRKLREWSASLASRQQLAAEKYADAVESIPLALAENAGMSVIDTQAELRTKSKEAGKASYGIDVFNGKVADLSTRDIYEPLTVKNQVINSATEGSVYDITYRQYNICVRAQKWGPTTRKSLWRHAGLLDDLDFRKSTSKLYRQRSSKLKKTFLFFWTNQIVNAMITKNVYRSQTILEAVIS